MPGQSIAAKHIARAIVEYAGGDDVAVAAAGSAAKWIVGLCTADILGLAADRVFTNLTSESDYGKVCPLLKPGQERGYDSEGEDEDDVKVNDHTTSHKVLKKVYPFLDMAHAAYKDTSMAKEFPNLVKKSHLIRDVKNPSRLFLGLVSTDTEVHVCILREGSVAFVFRGTEPSRWGIGFDLGDLLTDLAEKQKPVEFYDASDTPCYTAPPSIKAHKGFQLAFRDVTKTSNPEENLRVVAEALAGDGGRHIKRVFCIGHSLGGALATLCASWCRYVAFPSAEINCITLGSPRVGNRAFAMDFNQNVAPCHHSYRMVNKGDVVPALPHLLTYPKLSSAYKHVGGLVHFEEDPSKKDMIVFKHGGRRASLTRLKFEHHCCNAYVVSVSKALLKYKMDAKHKLEGKLHCREA